MVAIINAPTSIGQRLGVGLGQGLQNLAQQKMQQLAMRQQQARTQQGLEGLKFSPEEAQQLSGLDPQMLQHVIKERVRAKGSQDQTSNGLRAIVPGLSESEAREIGKLSPGLQQAWYRSIVGDLSGAQQQTQGQQATISPYDQQPAQQQSVPGLISSSQGASQQIAPMPLPPVERKALPVVSPHTDQERRDEHAAKKEARQLTTTERVLEAKAKREEKKAQAQEEKDKFKFNKGLREQIVKDSQSARGTLTDLNRIEELNKSGKLDTPGYVEFLKRSGLDIPALMNPESEEFQKIVQNFTKDAKTYFGGRVSNFEVEQFLKTVPSLSQSPEGRKRVMANLRRLSQAKMEYYDSYKDILKENRGVPPYDLLEKLEDKMESRYEKLGQSFRKDLEKEVPKGQNRLITALQSAFGSLVSSPTIQGGLAGAALGRVAGPIGAGLGALGGAGAVQLANLIRGN